VLNLNVPRCHIFLPFIRGLDSEVILQRIQATRSHALHFHYCNVDFVFFSIISHATLVLYYHASMLTLHTSLISRALWLPRAWYKEGESAPFSAEGPSDGNGQ